ncbi:tRNA-dihydrouridine(20) synthase [NAD(P)+]-like [Nymphon striatum]|nr:tRNA-dihydrouridine(20) synthase [NAD(P)+]-like [Nymphon striatum]
MAFAFYNRWFERFHEVTNSTCVERVDCHCLSVCNQNREMYISKVILAPMVRIGTLPTRLLALDYGADLVYTEEIVDHKLIKCRRVINETLGTVDFIDDDSSIVFRTCSKESDKVVLQIGSNDGQRALKAAKLVENDVCCIDLNMGCPKEFSLKGGMGAALLTQPDKIKEILTTLVEGLSKPIEDTIELSKLIESCGVVALAIHGRTKEQRPRHKNKPEYIKAVANSISIPVIAKWALLSTTDKSVVGYDILKEIDVESNECVNLLHDDQRITNQRKNYLLDEHISKLMYKIDVISGGSDEIRCYEDIEKFRIESGASSVMIARKAEYNLSILRKDGKLSKYEVIKDYLKYAIDYANYLTNTKYNIQQTLGELQDTEKGRKLLSAQTFEELGEIWGMKDYLDKKNEEFLKKDPSLKRNHSDNGEEDSGTKLRKVRIGSEDIYQIEAKFVREKNKKQAEQGAGLVAAVALNLITDVEERTTLVLNKFKPIS